MYNGTIAKGLETVIQGDGYSPEFEDLWVQRGAIARFGELLPRRNLGNH